MKSTNLYDKVKRAYKEMNKFELANEIIRILFAGVMTIIAFALLDFVVNLNIENMSSKQIAKIAIVVTVFIFAFNQAKELVKVKEK